MWQTWQQTFVWRPRIWEISLRQRPQGGEKEGQTESRATAMFDFFCQIFYFRPISRSRLSLRFIEMTCFFAFFFAAFDFGSTWCGFLVLKMRPITMPNFGSSSLALHTLTLLIWLLLFVFSRSLCARHYIYLLPFAFVICFLSFWLSPTAAAFLSDYFATRAAQPQFQLRNVSFNVTLQLGEGFGAKPNTDDDVVRYVMLMANHDSFDDYCFCRNESRIKEEEKCLR